MDLEELRAIFKQCLQELQEEVTRSGELPIGQKRLQSPPAALNKPVAYLGEQLLDARVLAMLYKRVAPQDWQVVPGVGATKSKAIADYSYAVSVRPDQVEEVSPLAVQGLQPVCSFDAVKVEYEGAVQALQASLKPGEDQVVGCPSFRQSEPSLNQPALQLGDHVRDGRILAMLDKSLDAGHWACVPKVGRTKALQIKSLTTRLYRRYLAGNSGGSQADAEVRARGPIERISNRLRSSGLWEFSSAWTVDAGRAEGGVTRPAKSALGRMADAFSDDLWCGHNLVRAIVDSPDWEEWAHVEGVTPAKVKTLMAIAKHAQVRVAASDAQRMAEWKSANEDADARQELVSALASELKRHVGQLTLYGHWRGPAETSEEQRTWLKAELKKMEAGAENIGSFLEVLRAADSQCSCNLFDPFNFLALGWMRLRSRSAPPRGWWVLRNLLWRCVYKIAEQGVKGKGGVLKPQDLGRLSARTAYDKLNQASAAWSHGAAAVNASRRFFEELPRGPLASMPQVIVALRRISKSLVGDVQSWEHIEELAADHSLLRFAMGEGHPIVEGLAVGDRLSLVCAILTGSLWRGRDDGGRIHGSYGRDRSAMTSIEGELWGTAHTCGRLEVAEALAEAQQGVDWDVFKLARRAEYTAGIDIQDFTAWESLSLQHTAICCDAMTAAQLEKLRSVAGVVVASLRRSESHAVAAGDLSASLQATQAPELIDRALAGALGAMAGSSSTSSICLVQNLGFFCPRQTLDGLGAAVGVTRERVRQIASAAESSVAWILIPLRCVHALDRSLWSAVQCPLPLLGAGLGIPEVRNSSELRRLGHLVQRFLGDADGADGKDLFRTPFAGEHGSAIWEEFFNSTQPPATHEMATDWLQGRYQCSEVQAQVFLAECVSDSNGIVLYNDILFPSRLRVLRSYILKSFPLGLHHKEGEKLTRDILKMGPAKGATVFASTATRDSDSRYLCGRGRYRHIQFMETDQEELETAVLELASYMELNSVTRVNLGAAIQAVPNISADAYYEVRWAVNRYGSEIGLSLDGKSSVDELRLELGFATSDSRQNARARVLAALESADGPISVADVAKRASVRESTCTEKLHRLVTCGQAVHVGRGHYTSADYCRTQPIYAAVRDEMPKCSGGVDSEEGLRTLSLAVESRLGFVPRMSWLRSVKRLADRDALE